MGGSPGAPPGAEWPVSPEGKLLAFVLQAVLDDPALPLAGQLSVFMDNSAGGYDLPHRLWLTPPGTPLRPLPQPGPVGSDLFGGLHPHGLKLRAGLDMPRWETGDDEAVVAGLTEDERDTYNEDFTWSLGPKPQARTLGKLFGHVAGIGSARGRTPRRGSKFRTAFTTARSAASFARPTAAASARGSGLTW